MFFYNNIKYLHVVLASNYNNDLGWRADRMRTAGRSSSLQHELLTFNEACVSRGPRACTRGQGMAKGSALQFSPCR